MKRLLLLLVVLSWGCTLQSEISRNAEMMEIGCTELGGLYVWRAEHGAVIKEFSCAIVISPMLLKNKKLEVWPEPR